MSSIFRWLFSIIFSSLIVGFSISLKKIERGDLIVPFLKDEVVTYFNKPHLHEDITCFYAFEKPDICSKNQKKHIKQEINSTLQCLKDSTCKNSRYIKSNSKEKIENRLLGFKSTFVDISNNQKVDYYNTFNYFSFLTNFFSLREINIIELNKSKNSYKVEVAFGEEINHQVELFFYKKDDELKLNDITGMRTLFIKVDSLILHDLKIVE